MLTTIITFLGSTAARLIAGKLFEAFEKWQDTRAELARMEAQARLEAAAHERNIAALKLQHDLGVRMVDAQSSAATQAALMDAFREAVQATRDKTGVRWVDAWNGSIRPYLATMAIVLWTSDVVHRGWVLNEWDQALIASVLGIFVGGRIAGTNR